MLTALRPIAATAIALACLAGATKADTLRFAGHDFETKQGRGLGPGPNDWSDRQVRVDDRGRLHLALSKCDGRWLAGEVRSVERFGFGTYEIDVRVDIAGLDKNVVFGFFTYPTSDVGPDGTREIDVEFARWGYPANKPLNFTVWPVKRSLAYGHRSFAFPQTTGLSRHRFVWSRTAVSYASAEIRADGSLGPQTTWRFAPDGHGKRIGTDPMPVFFNLWGFRGRPPSDGRPVKVVVEAFRFTPEK